MSSNPTFSGDPTENELLKALDPLDNGCFGQLAEAGNRLTDEVAALKIPQKTAGMEESEDSDSDETDSSLSSSEDSMSESEDEDDNDGKSTRLLKMIAESLTRLQRKYDVLEFLGEGAFGKVLKARNQLTKELVALKVMKKSKKSDYYFKKEVAMLDVIEQLDPDKFNIIKLIEHFEIEGHQLLAFEVLDMSVDNLQLQKLSFTLNEIRPMAKQLLTTLQGLQSINVLHADIKPDNIMLVNHKEQPFRVKMIDFGVAKHVHKLTVGKTMQPFAFRAPEVTLGLPVSVAADMWGLACCFMFWYVDVDHVHYLSEYDYISMMVDILGTPPDEMLNEGMYSEDFFVQEDSKWRIKTPQEYDSDYDGENSDINDSRKKATLEELIKTSVMSISNDESSDKEAFFDLLKKMFAINPKNRLSPSEALLHPFITMNHLDKNKHYTEVAQQYMRVTDTDFKPQQRESLQQSAEMLTDEREVQELTNVGRQKKSLGELTISSGTSNERLTFVEEDRDLVKVSLVPSDTLSQARSLQDIDSSYTVSDEINEEEANVVLVQERMGPSQAKNANCKVDRPPKKVAESSQAALTLEGEDKTFFVETVEVDDIQQLKVNDVTLAELLETAKDELSEESSDILEDIAKLFQEAEGNRKPPKSLLGRLRVLVSRLFNLLKPRPKKPFFTKPKWLKRVQTFVRRSTMTGPSTN